MTDMNHRQTGRTTRMVKDAIAKAREGRAVYIIVGNSAHRNNIWLRLKAEAIALGITEKDLGIKVEVATDTWIDWLFKPWGMNPRCWVVFDHYAIESRFAGLVEMLRRYDAPRSSEPLI